MQVPLLEQRPTLHIQEGEAALALLSDGCWEEVDPTFPSLATLAFQVLLPLNKADDYIHSKPLCPFVTGEIHLVS